MFAFRLKRIATVADFGPSVKPFRFATARCIMQNTMETISQPAPESSHQGLPMRLNNELQMQLIEEFRMDPVAWIERYSPVFRDITMRSKKLRDLAERDPDAAEQIIRRRLEAELPPPAVHRVEADMRARKERHMPRLDA